MKSMSDIRNTRIMMLLAIVIIISILSATIVSFTVQAELSKAREETATLKGELGDLKKRLESGLKQAPPEEQKRGEARAEGRVIVALETIEVEKELSEGVTYNFWTFNGTVPGPLIRVREGDIVEIRFTNSRDSVYPHSIDLHAVKGPGGGATLTQAAPGVTRAFEFKALRPGLYIYHCATPHIPTHVANGMYGLILVEPKEGLPPVDREFYIVQGEFYTKGKFGEKGHQDLDLAKLRAEQPEYVVFNGRVGALTGENRLKAKVGETIRIYVGNGGPNLVSSFHIIGEVFHKVYPEGAIGSEPITNIQTTLIPAGGAAIVEFQFMVPGNYVIVDHSLTRAIDKGALGIIEVTGPENPQVFRQLP